MSLFPEVANTLYGIGMKDIPLVAAGGVVEGRGAAPCLAREACGFVMGTRFLASKEATIAKGYQGDVLRTTDGGRTTVRTSVYDTLRGIEWPLPYNGRGIVNRSHSDAQNGMHKNENERLYEEALQKGDGGRGESGRVTAYAGSAVGLVTEVQFVKSIIDGVRQNISKVLPKASKVSAKL